MARLKAKYRRQKCPIRCVEADAAVIPGSDVTKFRSVPNDLGLQRPPGYRAEPQEKLPMQDFREITSALCDAHTILTYLLGIEMIQPTGLSDQAGRLEVMTVQAVTGLANVALSVDKTTESQERMG